MSQIENLEKLAELKKKGIITQEEFEEQKKSILSNINFGSDEGSSVKLSPFGYYKLCWKKYIQFSGRAGRPEYWWFYLFNFLIGLALGICSGIFVLFNPLLSNLFDWIGNIYSLAVLFPSLGVYTRRYHDIGKSAWFAFTPFFIFLGYFALSLVWLFNALNEAGEEGIYSVLIPYLGVTILVFAVLGIIWNIVFPCFASQKRPNKYGPQP